MSRRDSVQAGLLRQVLMIGFLAAAITFGPAFRASAEHPPSGGGSFGGLPSASLAAQTAENMSLNDQQFPPGAIIVSQIHNAPGWQPSHTYTSATGPYTRVVSGPGWDSANGRYNPGQTLNAYQLISTGRCTSASSGGPSGRESLIKDGTCTWKYLSNVDYISITGWAFDNQPWKKGTLYHYRDHVTFDSPLRAYALEDDSCASTVAPTGSGDAKSMVGTSDGCQWQYQADIIYTSMKSYIPTETFTKKDGPATLMLRANYKAELWNDREYIAGQNGEASPIRTEGHNDYRYEGGVILGCASSPCYHLIITTAQGESFRDRLTPSAPLTGYDPSKGVAIINSLPYRFPHEPAGFDVHDNYVDLIGLQIKSLHGAAVNGMSSYGNFMTIRYCILDGGSGDQWTSHAAVTTDVSSVIANSLVISHAQIGIIMKYPGFILHSTIVNPDHTAKSIGIETFYKWVYPGTIVSNTAIFGFTHAAAHDEGDTPWSPQSSHNMTDAGANDFGSGPGGPYSQGGTTMFDRLPGTTYGVSMASVFVKWGTDWRPSSGSPLRGAGRAVGTFSANCDAQNPACPQRMIYNFDTPNIIGIPRPQAGRYDIGAW